MTELGVLAYPDLSPMEKIKEYLQLASKYGFTRVSSSMLSVEGTNEEIISYFKEFNQIAHKFGMKVSLDVNTNFLKRMNQSYDDISWQNTSQSPPYQPTLHSADRTCRPILGRSLALQTLPNCL